MPHNASELQKLQGIKDRVVSVRDLVQQSLPIRAVGGGHVYNEMLGLVGQIDRLPEVAEDATPPTAPTNVVASSSVAGAVDVAFDVTFPTDAVSFDVLRSSDAGATFAVAGNVTTNKFSETGQTTGASLQYKVVAKDAAGNVSVDSNVATVVVA